MKKYRDIETNEIITERQLQDEFRELKTNGETECKTFAEYLRNCTSKNGTLEEVADIKINITLENINDIFPFNKVLIYHKAVGYAVPLEDIASMPIFKTAKFSHFSAIEDKIIMYVQ